MKSDMTFDLWVNFSGWVPGTIMTESSLFLLGVPLKTNKAPAAVSGGTSRTQSFLNAW